MTQILWEGAGDLSKETSGYNGDVQMIFQRPIWLPNPRMAEVKIFVAEGMEVPWLGVLQIRQVPSGRASGFSGLSLNMPCVAPINFRVAQRQRIGIARA